MMLINGISFNDELPTFWTKDQFIRVHPHVRPDLTEEQREKWLSDVYDRMSGKKRPKKED
ncbi:MAG: hypothetical protein LBF85_03730 [Tannerella sp.]|nr:hypothetical protein [Tannerella sp.]